MAVLDNLRPASVFRFFEELAAIPHGSGNTKQISDYCVKFAQNRGLEYWQDQANNVVIVKPASSGYETVPAIILQGHLDMVCEKTPDCTMDMEKEGLRLQTDGAHVWAENTTLGADNGIAVAMALALLDAKDILHPRIEAVFTTDEEIGLLGAAALDTSMLQGRKMLNLDSEAEGILTVSCAGGVRASCHVPVERDMCDGTLCTVEITGLVGGHSGVEIHKGRANAAMLLGRLLYGISQEMTMRLVTATGGQADNAIASHAVCSFLVPEFETERVAAVVESYARVFAREFQTADPGLTVNIRAEKAEEVPALQLAATSRVVSALMLLPNGIQSMSMDIPDLVQTSLNLGMLRLEEQEAVMTFAVRSSLATEKAMVCNRIECLSSLLGGYVTYAGDYPAWEYRKDSALRELVADVYEKQSGKKAVVEAIHAGLECGVFAGKLDDLDCVSLGPDLYEIHTPRERMSVASVARTWELVCEVLRRAGELR